MFYYLHFLLLTKAADLADSVAILLNLGCECDKFSKLLAKSLKSEEIKRMKTYLPRVKQANCGRAKEIFLYL